MIILGIDEVGRGPLAGPLVMGACVLPPRFDENNHPLESQLWQQELKDSKKLSAKKREYLDLKIRQKALAFGLGWVDIDELNQIGLSSALKLAARRAVEEAKNSNAKLNPEQIVIDGIDNFLEGTPYAKKATTIVKGDDKIKEVSAASILAKVARDKYMYSLAKEYPEYGFEKHVGYGTKQHLNALDEFGPCPEHRFFVKPVIRAAERFSIDTSKSQPIQPAQPTRPIQPATNTTTLGSRAEQVVADFLVTEGHKILSRNFKTRFYEIDIVSATKEHIYFTEVKYRKNSAHGSPLEAIDKKKQRRMTFAVNCYMKTLSSKLDRSLDALPSPILAAAAVEGKDFTLANWAPIVI